MELGQDTAPGSPGILFPVMRAGFLVHRLLPAGAALTAAGAVLSALGPKGDGILGLGLLGGLPKAQKGTSALGIFGVRPGGPGGSFQDLVLKALGVTFPPRKPPRGILLSADFRLSCLLYTSPNPRDV